MRLDHLLSKEFLLFLFFPLSTLMVGEGVGVGVAVCVTAPEVFNPAWRQNLPRVYGACESLLNVK